MEEYKNFWVIVELADGKPKGVGFELLNPGKQLAEQKNEKIVAVIIGKNAGASANQAIAYGAGEVIVVENEKLDEYSTDGYTYALEKLAQKYKPAALLVGATNNGLDLAPRLAARLNTGIAADCTGLALDEGGNVLWTRLSFNGKIKAEAVCRKCRPQIGTVRPGVFKRNEPDETLKGNVTKEDIDIPANLIRTRLVEKIAPETSETVDLETAEIIVTGGRGLGNADNFSIIRELASALGATVGASRSAVDSGWISHDHQVGQTGKTVQPQLYIACGVSGAIQHLAGMSGSHNVVAINTDEEAAIFKITDYGVVGDLTKVVPELTKVVKEIKEKNQ
ncbi:MAG: electron transfer flavoprotein subunit alpha/FixB family protein [Acidaminococcales bacterium]|jgi:electron transfer flavoprotein alpha subunit|nr:electron transfer flavoprotein subunit alpha/FixB family protein [Acidaminococcales bacterium]